MEPLWGRSDPTTIIKIDRDNAAVQPVTKKGKRKAGPVTKAGGKNMEHRGFEQDKIIL